MVLGLLTALAPIALQLIGWFLGKSAASDKAKQQFLDLVHTIESETGEAVKLSDSAKLQMQKLKDSLNGNPPSTPS